MAVSNSRSVIRRVANGLDKAVKEDAKKPPNPFSAASRHISQVNKVHVDTESNSVPPSGKVRLAFISLEGPTEDDFKDDSIVSDETARLGLDVEACERSLVKYDSKRIARNLRSYKAGLRAALAHEANVVCISELGLPVPANGPEAPFLEFSKTWAHTHHCVIFAGSFHDSRTKYNTGYVFSPGGPEEGYPFHKQVSAKDMGELVSVPAKRQSLIVPSFGLNIGVVVCLDILDYSTVANLVNQRELISFILVPACSPDIKRLEEVAAVASRAMPGGIGIVNSYRSDAPCSALYMFGDPVSEKPIIRDEDKKTLAERIVFEQPLRTGVGKISIYDIHYLPFHNEKNTRQDVPSDLDWLFRFPPSEPA